MVMGLNDKVHYPASVPGYVPLTQRYHVPASDLIAIPSVSYAPDFWTRQSTQHTT
jgi:hypothetical protein